MHRITIEGEPTLLFPKSAFAHPAIRHSPYFDRKVLESRIDDESGGSRPRTASRGTMPRGPILARPATRSGGGPARRRRTSSNRPSRNAARRDTKFRVQRDTRESINKTSLLQSDLFRWRKLILKQTKANGALRKSDRLASGAVGPLLRHEKSRVSAALNKLEELRAEQCALSERVAKAASAAPHRTYTDNIKGILALGRRMKAVGKILLAHPGPRLGEGEGDGEVDGKVVMGAAPLSPANLPRLDIPSSGRREGQAAAARSGILGMREVDDAVQSLLEANDRSEISEEIARAQLDAARELVAAEQDQLAANFSVESRLDNKEDEAHYIGIQRSLFREKELLTQQLAMIEKAAMLDDVFLGRKVSDMSKRASMLASTLAKEKEEDAVACIEAEAPLKSLDVKAVRLEDWVEDLRSQIARKQGKLSSMCRARSPRGGGLGTGGVDRLEAELRALGIATGLGANAPVERLREIAMRLAEQVNYEGCRDIAAMLERVGRARASS